MRAAIVGAGDLGGSTAAALAVRGGFREIQLIDDTGSVAAGKALDIQQTTPVHRSAALVTGSVALEGVADADVLVIADRPGGPAREWSGEGGLTLLRRLVALNARAAIVCAGASQDWLIEHAVAELGVDWRRIVGSAPIALEAAVRSLVALDASTSAARVVVRLAGRPPAALVADWESATIDGAPVPTRLDGLAVARLTRRLPYLWPPGPLALATAAAVMANGLAGGSRVPQLAFVALPGPEGRGGRTLMTPVRLETGRVAEARVATLPPSAQVALDNLLAR